MFKWIRKYTVVEWLAFLVIIAFNSWWPIWENMTIAATMCYASELLLLSYLFIHGRLRIVRYIGIALIMSIYFVLLQIFNLFHGSSLFIIFIIFAADALNKRECKNIIHLITRYLSFTIVISLIPWLIHQYITPLPLYDIIDVSKFKGGDGIYYDNYFWFISTGTDILRFYSLFDEPGVLGTLGAFILWANKYNFKNKDCIILLIGCIFTFSMAFYVMTIIGWLAYSKFKPSKVIISATAIFLIGFVLYNLLKDNLAFQQSIIERFTNYDEHDVESRTGFAINMLWDKTVHSSKIIFGLGSGAVKGMEGSSYKLFFLEYGIFGFLLIIYAYYKLIPKKNYYSIMTLCLFVISFLQRPQLFSAQNILLFTCIVKCFETQKVIINNGLSNKITNIKNINKTPAI